MREILEECFIPAPWGKIALISWGDPQGYPVLLVHGGEDSAATFIPVLELLPNKYHYVALDLPGHGKSDPFPISVSLLRIHFVIAIDVIVRHMQWEKFVYIGHSMGCEIGLYYNAVHSSKVSKFIHLDPGLSLQVLSVPSHYEYMSYHDLYYNDYLKNNGTRLYTRSRAIDAVIAKRELTERQADIILSRNMEHVEGDLFKLSWDRRVRFPKPMNLPMEYYLEVFSLNTPPTLVLVAKVARSFSAKMKEDSDKLLADLERTIDNFYIKTIDGTHDMHIIHPDRIVEDICVFLEKDFTTTKCKL